MFFPYSIEKQV